MVSLQSSHFLQTSLANFSGRLQQRVSSDSLGSSESSAFKKQNNNNYDQTLSEQRALQSLKNRDKEVKAHEMAHTSVGGQYTRGANFTYEKGSDGVLYAVAGEVSIDTSKVPNDPEATLRKARIIQRAALAPADPSAQDRQVATAAIAMAQQAQIEIAQTNKAQSDNSQSNNAQRYLENSNQPSVSSDIVNTFA